MTALLLVSATLARAETGATPVPDDGAELVQGEMPTDGASDSFAGETTQDPDVPVDMSEGTTDDAFAVDPVDESVMVTTVMDGETSGATDETPALPGEAFVGADADTVVGTTVTAEGDDGRIALSDPAPQGQSGSDGTCVLIGKDGQQLPCQ